MNSASQSQPDVEGARQLVGDIEKWTAQGWKLGSPVWFPLLCVAVEVLASVPVVNLLDSGNGVSLYYTMVSPLTAVACAWFFVSRRVQAPESRGGLAFLTGMVMLAATLGASWLYRGEWASAIPWLIVGTGLAVFAAAWRSMTTAAVAIVCVATPVIVAIADPEDGYSVVALAVGVTAALAVFVELVRADPARAS
ncbi:hypothetical protein [Nocardia iowensis]|uniref:Integral membrane protein n=1 Tax=Nocardia iowensis TaxID=204891 RepID=A0ABX8RHN4_NOCIO|nr:hypothetical protein [Nocardia iowensis]QXN88397.1 hypothetical protein KV110_22630 [Nocardia iowensis]